MLSEAVQVAAISALGGVLAGYLSKAGYDKFRNGRGNGTSVEQVIAQRAEVEFQTRMTMLMGQLTAAIERGHDGALEQMQQVAGAIADAAGAVREVHTELVHQREAVTDTRRMVKEVHQAVRRSA